ncbi:hypothetical protein AB1E18_004779 [Capra hircus]
MLKLYVNVKLCSNQDSVMKRTSTEKLVPLQPEAQNNSDGREPAEQSLSPLCWAAEPESQARGGRASSRRAGKRGSSGEERICEGERRPACASCSPCNLQPIIRGDVQLIKGRLAASANSKAPQIKRDCCNSWRIMQRKTLPGNSPSVEMRPREE